MRALPLCATLLFAAAVLADEAPSRDEVQAVQRRTLREARRLELTPYGAVSIGDPYLQRWGGGLRVLWHLREGLALGLDGNGFGSWATQELVIARRELHANVIESRERLSLSGIGAIAPLYGKVALPGDILVRFETFLDAGLGAAVTETNATRGVRPKLLGGIGQRMFLGEDFALTARVGGDLYAEHVVINGQTSTKAMGFWSFSLGLSVYLPRMGER